MEARTAKRNWMDVVKRDLKDMDITSPWRKLKYWQQTGRNGVSLWRTEEAEHNPSESVSHSSRLVMLSDCVTVATISFTSPSRRKKKGKGYCFARKVGFPSFGAEQT